jgi:hypothetical protein
MACEDTRYAPQRCGADHQQNGTAMQVFIRHGEINRKRQTR